MIDNLHMQCNSIALTKGKHKADDCQNWWKYLFSQGEFNKRFDSVIHQEKKCSNHIRFRRWSKWSQTLRSDWLKGQSFWMTWYMLTCLLFIFIVLFSLFSGQQRLAFYLSMDRLYYLNKLDFFFAAWGQQKEKQTSC